MVKEIGNRDKIVFRCEECGLDYAEKIWAEKCQAWCGEHHSCNIEIIKHAVTE